MRSASASSEAGGLVRRRCVTQELGGEPGLGAERLLDALFRVAAHRPGEHRARHDKRQRRGRERREKELALEAGANPHALARPSGHAAGGCSSSLYPNCLIGDQRLAERRQLFPAAAARARRRCACHRCSDSPTRRSAACRGTARGRGGPGDRTAAGTPWPSVSPATPSTTTVCRSGVDDDRSVCNLRRDAPAHAARGAAARAPAPPVRWG